MFSGIFWVLPTDLFAKKKFFFFYWKDITIPLKNNYNTHTAQYLTKQRQPDNGIWSGNRI